MKSTTFFKFRTIVFGLLAALLFSIQGCIEDDLSVCGVSVTFAYTRNTARADKLDSIVNQINLFVFDAQGKFVDLYTSKGTIYKGYTMTLPLLPGEYEFIAWGNLSEDYEINTFERGVTTRTEAMLSLRRGEDNVVNNRIGDLFHGSERMVVKPDLQSNQRDTVDLIKDTKNIIVTVKGLPIEANATPEDCGYACSITSRNGDYKFDNSIIATKQLQYIPQARIDEERNLIADFITLREQETNITQSKLIVTRTSAPPTRADLGTELQSLNLVELLSPIAVRNGFVLDIEDRFEIELIFDFANGTCSIFINGWEFDNSEGMITNDY
jgi:hypothetical protein